MVRKKLNKKVRYAVSAVLLVLAVWSVVSQNRYHTYDALELISTIMLTSLVAMLHILPLDLPSYITLLSLMIIEKERFIVFFTSQSFFAVFFLIDLILVIWLKHGSIKEYFTNISVVSLCAVVLLTVYDAVTTKLTPLYYDIGRRFSLSAEQKALLISAFSGVVVIVFAVTVRLAAKFFWKNSDRFLLVEKRLSGLWAYTLIFLMILLIIFDVSENLADIGYFSLGVFRMLIIFAAAVYICLLLKAASIREKMNAASNLANELAAYSGNLETTLEDIRDIRHDMKNLLFTMGGFVEKNGDEEMKAFYQDNIVPFMRNTVAKSDLQAKLSVICDGRLKSFLYYKIIEKLELGVHADVEISPTDAQGSGDIVRLLGIFIDNAAEEALLCEGRHIRVGISEDEYGTSFTVANDVRPIVRERGVIAGTTEKGVHRGRGLLIAKKIIGDYDNIILNSYFTDTQFVQCLTVLREKP